LPLLRRFVEREPNRILLVEDRDRAPGASGRLGACGNFGRLLQHSDADYVLLSDQDDVWLPGRISKPLARIKAVEQDLGADTPVLAHTDLVVADENLRTIARSFWSYRHLDPYRGIRLNQLLVQNVVTGCASMMNRALARLASPIPALGVPMHDWWLALVASAFGRIEVIPEATVLYRQHPTNHVGATRHDWRYVARRAAEVLFGGAVAQRHHRSRRQVAAFLQRYALRLRNEYRTMARDFLQLKDVDFLRRRRLLLKHGFFGTSPLRNLAWLVMI